MTPARLVITANQVVFTLEYPGATWGATHTDEMSDTNPIIPPLPYIISADI